MKIVRNILAVIFGLIIGGFVNMTIITYGGAIIPPPDGVNPNDIESIKANMYLYQKIHFVVPFLAHALGTFVGAFIASVISSSHQLKFAIGIGCFYLMGGIMMVFMLPSPMWFNVLDLTLAYIPMGWLGWKLSEKFISKTLEVHEENI